MYFLGLFPNGLFDLKEAYKLASLEIGDATTGVIDGEWLWKVATIPKIKFFLWQCFHHSIPICATIAARGMDVPQICPFVMKALRPSFIPLEIVAKLRYFGRLPPPMDVNLFFKTKLADWLRLNSYNSKVCSSSSVFSGSVFPFGIWSLWLRRNETIFRNTRNQRCLKAEVLSRAIEYANIGINNK